MINDAELHADEDKKKHALVDAKNTAESLLHQTEKTLKEHGDKVDAATKTSIEAACEELKKVKDGTDTDAIKEKSEALTQASHKLAEAMYQQAAQDSAAPGQEQQGAAQDDDVVDADFEEVKDDKK